MKCLIGGSWILSSISGPLVKQQGQGRVPPSDEGHSSPQPMETRHAAQFAWGAQNIPFPSARGADCPWLYVDLFISSQFISHLLSRTNERLDSMSAALTNPEEMSLFLWLRDYMGIADMPRLKMCWEKDRCLATSSSVGKLAEIGFLRSRGHCLSILISSRSLF